MAIGVVVLALLVHRGDAGARVSGSARFSSWAALLLVAMLAALSPPRPLSLVPPLGALAASLPLLTLVAALEVSLLAVLLRLAVGGPCSAAARLPGHRRALTTVLAGGLTALLLVQLGLAIVQRLHPHLLWLHMLVGLALVTPLGVHVGIRTWLDGERAEPGGRLGPLLLAALACQLLLGVAAWGVTAPPALALLLVTLHFWLGPLLLALVLASY